MHKCECKYSKNVTQRNDMTHRYYNAVVFLIYRSQGYGWIAYAERMDANRLLQRQTFESDLEPDKQEQVVSTVYTIFPFLDRCHFTTTKQLIGIFVHAVISVTQGRHPTPRTLIFLFFVRN